MRLGRSPDMVRPLGVTLAILVTACQGSTLPTASTIPTQPVAAQPSATPQPTPRQHVTIKLSHTQPADLRVGKEMQLFADEVKKRSNGDMDVQIFPAGQLYTDAQSIPAVQRGEVDIILTVNAVWTSLVPANNILDLPFKFASWEVFHSNIDGQVGQLLTKQMEEKGVKTIASLDSGAIDLIGTRERLVKTVADLKGLRMRSYSQAVSQLLIGWGAAPTTIAATDVYSAAQRGTIDGLISGPSFFERKWYEVTPYLTYVPVQYSPFWLQANLTFWNKLAPDQQKVLLDAGKVAQERNRTENPKEFAAAYDQLRKLAKGWYEVPAADIKQWQQNTSSIDTWYLQQAGDLGKQLLAAIK